MLSRTHAVQLIASNMGAEDWLVCGLVGLWIGWLLGLVNGGLITSDVLRPPRRVGHVDGACGGVL